MATVNFINRPKGQSRAGLKAILSYTMKPTKTEYENQFLVSGLDCTPESVYQEFINTKLLYGKDEGRMYYHFVQSLPKDEAVSPITAHEIAMKLAEFYQGFEVLVATHTDREHLHSHFIINSVSHETGKKLHQSAHTIQALRVVSDQLCMEYGLSLCQPNKHQTAGVRAGEYHTAMRGESWKMRLANTIDECMQYASTPQMFMELMESEGYKVRWEKDRKSITYTAPDGKKCRDNKLHEEKYLKENMEIEFIIRRKMHLSRIESTEQKWEFYRRLIRESFDLSEAGRRALLYGGADGATESEFGAVVANPIESSEMREQSGQQPLPHSTEAEVSRNPRGTDQAEQEYFTGWEQERGTFVRMQTQSDGNEMASHFALSAEIVGGVVATLAHAERAVGDVPIKDATTMPQPKRKRKQGVAQDKDEKQDQTYSHTMTMY